MWLFKSKIDDAMAKMKEHQMYTSHKIENEKNRTTPIQLCVQSRYKTTCSWSLANIGEYFEYILFKLSNRYISVFFSFIKKKYQAMGCKYKIIYRILSTKHFFSRITLYIVMCVPLKRRTKKNITEHVLWCIWYTVYPLHLISSLVILAIRIELPLSLDKLMYFVDICVSYKLQTL